MDWPNTPESRPVIRQINWLFHSATIYDIDFNRWYESISMILLCHEYIGDDFPGLCGGWFQLKFLNAHTFVFHQQKTEKHPFVREWLGLSIRKFTKEFDKETGKRYYCLVLGDLTLEWEPCLEIHFDDAEVKFLAYGLENMESNSGFLSHKDRERLLRGQE